jgi:hypothetical protein
MTNQIKSTVSPIIISLFVFLFAYTGLSKIFHHSLFVVTLRQSPLLNSYAGLISRLLPFLELCTALLLIIKKTQKLALYITLALMLIFTFYILYLLLFVTDLPCSCGGVVQSLSWSGHLILNLFLVFLSLFEILLTNMLIYRYTLKTN